MISRDWQCLNGKCRNVFHSYETANPPCPVCGCVRVNWVPGGGHIMAVATRIDSRLRSIADQHGMTNLNSASHSRLNRAAPKVDTPPMTPELGVKHWGMGIYSGMSAHGPVCVPASNAVDVRGKVAVGPNAPPRDHSASIPGPGANSVVAARTTQRGIT